MSAARPVRNIYVREHRCCCARGRGSYATERDVDTYKRLTRKAARYRFSSKQFLPDTTSLARSVCLAEVHNHTHTHTHTHADAARRQPRRQLRQNRWWAVAFASRMDKLAPWERQQTKTFIAWANSFLARDGLAITNIESDLEDGIKRKRRCTRSESDVQVGPRVPLQDAQRDVSHNRRQKQRLASPSGPIRTLFVCCVCVCVCVSCGGWVA